MGSTYTPSWRICRSRCCWTSSRQRPSVDVVSKCAAALVLAIGDLHSEGSCRMTSSQKAFPSTRDPHLRHRLRPTPFSRLHNWPVGCVTSFSDAFMIERRLCRPTQLNEAKVRESHQDCPVSSWENNVRDERSIVWLNNRSVSNCLNQ